MHFRARSEILRKSYFRAFPHDGFIHAMAMPGRFYRSRDGLKAFEEDGRTFLLYAVAGESGLAIAEVHWA